MAKKVKIETEYGTISATPEQAKSWKAREEQDKVQKERIATVRQNTRTLKRWREQKQIYKDQTKARERRASGGYDATPTNMYGKPIESFWAKEPPAMPEMKPVPAMPEVPQLPTPALADRMRTPEAIKFYERAELEMNPYINTNLPSLGNDIGSAPIRQYNYGGYPESQRLGYVYPFTERTITRGTPIRQSNFLNIGPYRTAYGLPVFPYYPRVL